jgi:hypothetical protein
VLEGPAGVLRERDDVKAFYLGEGPVLAAPRATESILPAA